MTERTKIEKLELDTSKSVPFNTVINKLKQFANENGYKYSETERFNNIYCTFRTGRINKLQMYMLIEVINQYQQVIDFNIIGDEYGFVHINITLNETGVKYHSEK